MTCPNNRSGWAVCWKCWREGKKCVCRPNNEVKKDD